MLQSIITAEEMFEELRKEVALTVSDKGVLRVNGLHTSKPDKFWEQISSTVRDICLRLELPGLLLLEQPDQHKWAGALRKLAIDVIRGENQKVIERPEDLEGLVLCQKLGQIGLFVYDETSETIIPEDILNEENYNLKLGRELANAERDDIMDVVSVFVPNREKSWLDSYKISETRTWHNVRWVNEYRYPEYHSLPDPGGALPVEIEKLFDHVFSGDPETIHQVKSWIHNALVHRCQNYLVLSGAPAIGKTLLLDDVVRAIMGRDHSASAPTDFHNTQWNTILENRVYLYYDEGGLDNSKKLARAKEYANITQTPNTKFVNSVKSIRNHTSQAFSCNKEERFVFEPDDRKFYCPDLTDRPLGVVLDEVEIADMKEKLAHDLEYQARIGFYFRRYKTDINPFTTAVKTKTFWRLHDDALLGFKEWLLAEFRNTSYETVMYPKELAKAYKRFDKNGRGGNGRSNGFHPSIRIWLKLMASVGRPVVEIDFEVPETFIEKGQSIEVFRSLICEEDISDADLDDL